MRSTPTSFCCLVAPASSSINVERSATIGNPGPSLPVLRRLGYPRVVRAKTAIYSRLSTLGFVSGWLLPVERREGPSPGRCRAPVASQAAGVRTFFTCYRSCLTTVVTTITDVSMPPSPPRTVTTAWHDLATPPRVPLSLSPQRRPRTVTCPPSVWSRRTLTSAPGCPRQTAATPHTVWLLTNAVACLRSLLPSPAHYGLTNPPSLRWRATNLTSVQHGLWPLARSMTRVSTRQKLNPLHSSPFAMISMA